MLLVLSQYSPGDTAREQRIAQGRAERFIQAASTAATHPLPPDIRWRAGAIVIAASTNLIDGSPADYTRCQIVVRSSVGYGKVDLADLALAQRHALTRGTATFHYARYRDSSVGP